MKKNIKKQEKDFTWNAQAGAKPISIVGLCYGIFALGFLCFDKGELPPIKFWLIAITHVPFTLMMPIYIIREWSRKIVITETEIKEMFHGKTINHVDISQLKAVVVITRNIYNSRKKQLIVFDNGTYIPNQGFNSLKMRKQGLICCTYTILREKHLKQRFGDLITFDDN